jgi:hypothetical protein
MFQSFSLITLKFNHVFEFLDALKPSYFLELCIIYKDLTHLVGHLVVLFVEESGRKGDRLLDITNVLAPKLRCNYA